MYLTHFRSQGTGVDWGGGLGLWACPTLLMVNECRSIRAVESTKLPRKTFLKNECNGEKISLQGAVSWLHYSFCGCTKCLPM